MSEINAIATNNFILHNIDAKKLYVQEPLFTANSGDAVYVGWRPDETVLWSGDQTTSAFNIALSETCQNFEMIRFEGITNNGAGWPMNGLTYTNSVRDGGKMECSLIGVDPNHFKATVMEMSGTNLKCIQMFEKNMLTTGTGTSRNDFHITKVIGINRKENA